MIKYDDTRITPEHNNIILKGFGTVTAASICFNGISPIESHSLLSMLSKHFIIAQFGYPTYSDHHWDFKFRQNGPARFDLEINTVGSWKENNRNTDNLLSLIDKWPNSEALDITVNLECAYLLDKVTKYILNENFNTFAELPFAVLQIAKEAFADSWEADQIQAYKKVVNLEKAFFYLHRNKTVNVNGIIGKIKRLPDNNQFAFFKLRQNNPGIQAQFGNIFSFQAA